MFSHRKRLPPNPPQTAKTDLPNNIGRFDVIARNGLRTVNQFEGDQDLPRFVELYERRRTAFLITITKRPWKRCVVVFYDSSPPVKINSNDANKTETNRQLRPSCLAWRANRTGCQRGCRVAARRTIVCRSAFAAPVERLLTQLDSIAAVRLVLSLAYEHCQGRALAI
ncbi:unnamed protein product [Nesidiocoris tenuis]|uniref:Uncharacterized protein n=1 Tax=Nesidiocoris tenuis TaxID=355587 RepID=A0A6H5GM63_9HEMI|nr:unnamed protein product [Nesidiocoris tenuis]